MPKKNSFDLLVKLKMQNWQNMEALWSFVGIQYTLNAAWWVATIHNVLKINLYAEGSFSALSLCFYYITVALTLKTLIFFFLFKQHILFSSWTAQLGAEIGL